MSDIHWEQRITRKGDEFSKRNPILQEVV